MITFELTDIYRGWKGSGVPDDLTVRISDNGTEMDAYVCIDDLLIAYGYLSNQATGEYVFGTNLFINFKPEEDEMEVMVKGEQITTSAADLRDGLERVLTDIFTEVDQLETASYREESLDALAVRMDGQPYEIDVWALYEELKAE